MLQEVVKEMRLPGILRLLSAAVLISPMVALSPLTGWAAEDAEAAATIDDSIPRPPGAKTSGPQDMESQARPAKAPSYQPSSEELAMEPVLRERIKRRWDALVAREFKAAYGFETPAYRKEHTEKEFASEFGSMVDWHVATVKELRYDRPDEVKVVIALDYSFPMPNSASDTRTTGFFKETWVSLDGEWWRRNNRQPLGGGK